MRPQPSQIANPSALRGVRYRPNKAKSRGCSSIDHGVTFCVVLVRRCALKQPVIDSDGTVHCLYDERIPLTQVGQPLIRHGSHVDPDSHGPWPCINDTCSKKGAIAALIG